MNPENTYIVIRKRNVGEVMNLAFRIVARHLAGILCAGVLALPFCVLPWCVYYGVVMVRPEWAASLFNEFEYGEAWWGLLGIMALTVIVLEPLVTAPVTLLLGQLVFGGGADWKRLRREFLESLPQIFYYRYLWFFTTFRWAFCSEVILLERNPWLASEDSGKRTTSQRCRDIYWRDYESIYRLFASYTWVAVLSVSVFAGIMMLHSVITGTAGGDGFMVMMCLFYLPWMLWAGVFYQCVIRFLGYLDFRIRSEGWDIDLKIREECVKMDRGRVVEDEE